MSNIFPIDFEEKLTMAQNDYILFSDSEDGNKIKKAQYKNLKGEPGTPGTPGKDGEDGAAATITVGSTTTGAAGSSASVTNSGTSSAAVFNFTIPQGAKGEPGEDGQDGADGAAATITVGTTTTLPAGSSATVTNVGTSQDAILNFGIPKGDAGTGSGDVNGPASSTDGDVALFDGATGKLIKDSGVSLSDYQEKLTAGTNIQISASNVISATAGSDIVYATQAEYNALLPGALTDGKHYFIYSTDGGGGWQPGANTIGYRPLETDLKDYSGNNYDFTTYSGTTTFVNGMVQTNGKISRNNVLDVSNNFTLLMYIVPNSDNNAESYLFFSDNNNLANANFGYGFGSYRLGWVVNGTREGNYYSASLDGNPHLLCVTKNGNSYDLYLDGVFAKNETTSVAIPSSTYMVLGNVTSNTKTMKFGKLIIEDRIRTDIEISNYYDQTKSTYGIS